MSLTSKNIQVGSGSLYIYAYDETATPEIPADATLEVEDNRLGHIKGGATITYDATFVEIKDDLGLVGITSLTEESVTFKTGVITWNPDTLAKLAATATVTSGTGKSTLNLGGLSHYQRTPYILRFVSNDLKKRVTLVGNPASGFEFSFNPEEETNIDVSFKAQPMVTDGYLLHLEVKD